MPRGPQRLDPATVFESTHLRHDLVGKSVRGGVTTLASQGIKFALGTASTVVLARLLTPADYGLVAMVTVVVNFATMFKDAGLSMATVQKERITQEQISSLFWINMLICAVLGLCVLSGSPLVAWFYGKPELTAVTMALSFSFIISGLTIQHQALLQRHMRFGALAAIQIATQAVSLATTIALALTGWRYWALVGGSLTTALVGTLFTFYYCPWFPGTMLKGSNVRNMLKFGGHLTGFNFVNYFARNADQVLIGKLIGAQALGIYGRAYQILTLPITMMSGPLSGVALPAMSRLSGDRNRLHRYYLRVLQFLSLIAGLIAGISFLTSTEIVSVLLGPRWSSVGDVFRYLAIGGLLQPLYNTQSWLHLAVGRSDRVFRWGLIGTPVIVTSFFVGSFWGINGVAFCYSMAIIVTTCGSLAYAGQSTGLSIRRIILSVYRPLSSCIVAVSLSAALVGLMPAYSSVVAFAAKASIFVLVYTLALLLFYRGPGPFFDAVAMVRLVANGKGRRRHG
jgi:PST family polysaccharide transporter